MNNLSNASNPDGHDPSPASSSSLPSTVNGALSDVSRDAGAALSDVQAQLQGTVTAVGDRMSKAGARLGAQLNTAKLSVEKAAAATSDRARVTATATNGYIHDHPWQAIGISTALGFLIGMVLARRR